MANQIQYFISGLPTEQWVTEQWVTARWVRPSFICSLWNQN